jgi:hypothetical protein
MSDKMPSRGFQGAVRKLLRAGEYQLTVTGRRELTPQVSPRGGPKTRGPATPSR